MRPTTWLLRRLAEFLLFVVTVAAVSALQTGSVRPLLVGTTGAFIAYWAIYYAIFSGYLIISAILYATFRKSTNRHLPEVVDSLAFVLHSYAAVSVIYGWPVGLGAGVDIRSPPIIGWCTVLCMHLLLLVAALVTRLRTGVRR